MNKTLVFLLSISLCFLLFGTSVSSTISKMQFKIVFSEPSKEVLEEKERIIALYKELSYGVKKESMREVMELSKDRFLEGNVEEIEIKGNTMTLYMDKKGKMFISGTFFDACEGKVVKKSLIGEMLRK